MNKGQDKLILIVDDNPFNRQIIKEFLKIEGYTVDEAASGKEAFAILSGKTYRLILMDLLMPGMNGFEVAERIRDMGIVTPIIAQSSLSTREDQRRSMEAGCNAFLPKPVNFPDLKNIVKKYISEYSQEEPQKIQKYGFETTDTPTLSIISGHKVLLVEESKIKADHFSEQLSGCGFNVLHVTNGDLAWDYIKEQKRKFDIVISNIFTSGIDGLGLLVKIKNENSNQPVLIYTEEYDNDTFQLALQLGADGIVPVTKFDDKIIDIIESPIYHSKGKSSYLHSRSISHQVRESQAGLIAISEIDKSQYIDLGYLALHEAGGDSVHYREFNKAGRIGLVIMDVAGHDIGSSYISAIAFGILNSIWDMYPDPQELLNQLNSEILKIGGGEYQICTTAVLWDQWRRRIKIAVAGNPGGLLLLNSNSGFYKPV
ncbi:MAG: response regulator, partial [Candidatus Heimdallarchaeota archaeon]|nr:response regulator [Candidatus Heimdallarchaeota archaeon]